MYLNREIPFTSHTSISSEGLLSTQPTKHRFLVFTATLRSSKLRDLGYAFPASRSSVTPPSHSRSSARKQKQAWSLRSNTVPPKWINSKHINEPINHLKQLRRSRNSTLELRCRDRHENLYCEPTSTSELLKFTPTHHRFPLGYDYK